MKKWSYFHISLFWFYFTLFSQDRTILLNDQFGNYNFILLVKENLPKSKIL